MQVIDGYVYINGEVLDENYGLEVMDDPGIAAESHLHWEKTNILCWEIIVIIVQNSRDPSVGVLHRNDIMGRAWIRIWPFDKFGVIKHE